MDCFFRNHCEGSKEPILSMLLSKNSYVSTHWLNGYYLNEFNKYDIAGYQVLFAVSIYFASSFIEIFLTIVLNLDVITTIRSPFNRSKNLSRLLIFLRSGIIFTLLFVLVGWSVVFVHSESVTLVFTKPEQMPLVFKDKASVMLCLVIFIDSMTFFIYSVYACL